MPQSEAGFEEVRRQLAEILESKDFRASERLQAFLTYIVEESLNGRRNELKAFKIALEVFKQGQNFDPTLNPLVRVEAGRLRGKLDHYYLVHPDAPVRITIPKGGYGAFFTSNPSRQPAAASAAGCAAAHSYQGKQTSLLILPFANISGKEEADRFINGLSNEISTSLTRFTDLAVVCAGSAASGLVEQKNSGFPEARFALSGGVEIEGDTLKAWICLSDLNNGVNIWAERYGGSLSAGRLDLQESIAENIASRVADGFGLITRTLQREMIEDNAGHERQREAALLYYRWTTLLTLDSFQRAVTAMERVVAEAPDNMAALAMLADMYASDYQWSYGVVEASLERSLPMAVRAVNQDPGCQIAHLAAALNYYLRAQDSLFQVSADKALALNPSNVGTLSALASWNGLMGHWERAFELLQKAEGLYSGLPGWCRANNSLYNYLHGNYEAALIEANKIMMPGTLWDAVCRLTAAAHLGLAHDAERAKADLLGVYPDFAADGGTVIEHNVRNKKYVAKILRGLSLAGFHF